MKTRQEFSDYFNRLKPNLGDEDSPLWEAEYELSSPCVVFVSIKPIKFENWFITKHCSKENRPYFWVWCDKNLKGTVRCFSSSIDGNEEWWGFTDPSDVVIWLLKWS